MRVPRPRPLLEAALGALVTLLTAAGCGGDERTFVVVEVELGAPALEGRLFSLAATVQAGALAATRTFARPNGAALAFPTNFSIEIADDVAGPIDIDVRALGAAGEALAGGLTNDVALERRGTREITLLLTCLGTCSDTRPSDGGNVDAPGAVDAGTSLVCGNGRLDLGESCDLAIAAGRAGRCPTLPSECDDRLACTSDAIVGTGCAAACAHVEVTVRKVGDGCCPAGATSATDPDCSATCGNGTIETGETCDTSIAARLAGACPSTADCDDGNPCTTDVLLSAGTCSARCVHHAVFAFVAGDRCCPADATHADDPDCPIVCGNGVLDEGETCEAGLEQGAPGACPPACDDGNACTVDRVEGGGCRQSCRHDAISALRTGDGCCPPGATAAQDGDCPRACGNGRLEAGEACDPGIAAGMPGACPSACPSTACARGTLLGSAATCSARCAVAPVGTCGPADGCCPAACTSDRDADCSATCGNGVRDVGEACDTAIAAGAPGACPAACDDANACTSDRLEGAGTCHATCVHDVVTFPAPGDGCCPAGATASVDTDCAVVCGDGRVDARGETCDRAIPAGQLGACAATCPAGAGCGRFTLRGAAATCDAFCAAVTLEVCGPSDGCCPGGCSRDVDPDCAPVCGNGVVDEGEACDRGLTAGLSGACARSCDDADACTFDVASGRTADCTRACGHVRITACAAGDGCCPTGCSGANDSDCRPQCGDGVVAQGETCDPPGSCPTTCPDDGDPCTTDRLAGDPARCNARCVADPVRVCKKDEADRCCPTGCTDETDRDCKTNR